jgi:hypothetical protein
LPLIFSPNWGLYPWISAQGVDEMPKMVVSVVMGGAMIFMGAATTDAADPIPAKLPVAVGRRPGTSVRSCGLACEQFVLLRGVWRTPPFRTVCHVSPFAVAGLLIGRVLGGCHLGLFDRAPPALAIPLSRTP